MSKKLKAKILSLWKQGRNVWEISQLTGAPEKDVMDVVQGRHDHPIQPREGAGRPPINPQMLKGPVGVQAATMAGGLATKKGD